MLLSVALGEFIVALVSVLLTSLVNKMIVVGQILLMLAAVLTAVVPNAVYAPMDVVPVPKGCYSMNCSHLVTVGGTFSAGVSFVLSVSTVVLGCVFQYVHFKYRNSKKSAKPEAVKLNQFARYSFYIRLVFETTPYMTDLILVHSVGLRIGTIIGPYGVLGCSLDFCICTMLYYILAVKTKNDQNKVGLFMVKKISSKTSKT
ncbi:hypothetical protein QR680_015235 [Steinernema hermaphroditum]|uniref:Uncharacterized protein n=1 Tax=Steinernema hermaphroditum TaxID=289476 RepID=A0AA39H789_9BILA|nr:hypothetical protein QR680_015235 [Steinernema hermaphroditum]